jgi:hypothetical protein
MQQATEPCDKNLNLSSPHTGALVKRCLDISPMTGYFVDPFGTIDQHRFNLTVKSKPVIIKSITHEESPF